MSVHPTHGASASRPPPLDRDTTSLLHQLQAESTALRGNNRPVLMSIDAVHSRLAALQSEPNVCSSSTHSVELLLAQEGFQMAQEMRRIGPIRQRREAIATLVRPPDFQEIAAYVNARLMKPLQDPVTEALEVFFADELSKEAQRALRGRWQARRKTSSKVSFVVQRNHSAVDSVVPVLFAAEMCYTEALLTAGSPAGVSSSTSLTNAFYNASLIVFAEDNNHRGAELQGMSQAWKDILAMGTGSSSSVEIDSDEFRGKVAASTAALLESRFHGILPGAPNGCDTSVVWDAAAAFAEQSFKQVTAATVAFVCLRAGRWDAAFNVLEDAKMPKPWLDAVSGIIPSTAVMAPPDSDPFLLAIYLIVFPRVADGMEPHFSALRDYIYFFPEDYFWFRLKTMGTATIEALRSIDCDFKLTLEQRQCDPLLAARLCLYIQHYDEGLRLISTNHNLSTEALHMAIALQAQGLLGSSGTYMERYCIDNELYGYLRNNLVKTLPPCMELMWAEKHPAAATLHYLAYVRPESRVRFLIELAGESPQHFTVLFGTLRGDGSVRPGVVHQDPALLEEVLAQAVGGQCLDVPQLITVIVGLRDPQRWYGHAFAALRDYTSSLIHRTSESGSHPPPSLLSAALKLREPDICLDVGLSMLLAAYEAVLRCRANNPCAALKYLLEHLTHPQAPTLGDGTLVISTQPQDEVPPSVLHAIEIVEMATRGKPEAFGEEAMHLHHWAAAVRSRRMTNMAMLR